MGAEQGAAGKVNAVISRGRGSPTDEISLARWGDSSAAHGATKEGPLVAAGPKEEVKETRVGAKPKGGRRGPGLCRGSPPI